MTEPVTEAGRALLRVIDDPARMGEAFIRHGGRATEFRDGIVAIEREAAEQAGAARNLLDLDDPATVERLADRIAEPDFDRLLLDEGADRHVVARAILAALTPPATEADEA